MRLVRSIVTAVVPAVAVLRDDPWSFWLLVAQQLPHRAVAATARPVAFLLRAPVLAPARATALWVLGRQEEAVRVVEGPRVDARRAASFLVSVRMFSAAEERLAGAPAGTRSGNLARARLRWGSGRLREAVALADALPRQGGGVGDRMRGELALLEPAQVGPVRGSALRARAEPRRPVPDHARTGDGPTRVMHLLTNSLPFTRSGYTSRTHSILRAQSAVGLQVDPVTRLGYPATVGLPTGRSEDLVDGVRYRRLTTGWLPLRADARVAREADVVAAEVERTDPSVLHTTTHYVNALVAETVRSRTGVPFVYEVRGFLEETWLSKQERDASGSDRYVLWRERETDAMQSADAVVTLGEEMRQEIIARGISPDKVLLSPNAVGDAFLGEPPDPSSRRRSLAIQPDDVVVGTITSVVDYEGLETAVAAVDILRRSGHQVVLLVVGDGPARARLEGEVRSRGIRAVFTGRVPATEVHELHSCIDVFLVPRRDERVCRLVTPMKPLEAMATSRPVVASDLPALREIVVDGRTGRLFVPGEPEDLASVLAELITDPSRRQQMGAAGRDFVLGERTWSRNAEMYRSLYARLTSEV